MNPAYFYRLVQAHCRIEEELAESRKILMALLLDAPRRAETPPPALDPPRPAAARGTTALTERALKECGGAVHVNQLFDRLRDLGFDGPEKAVRGALHGLTRRGVVVHVKHGVWMHASVHTEGEP